MNNRFLTACAALLLLGLANCTNAVQNSGPQTGASSAPASSRGALAEDRWVGVFVPDQSGATDRLMGPFDAEGRPTRDASAYFVEMREKVLGGEAGFRGATGTVTLTIRMGEQIFWQQEVTLGEHGMASVMVPAGTRIPNGAALCVQASWRMVQRRTPHMIRPGQNMACTADGWLANYFRNDPHPRTGVIGRGRAIGDRANVITVKRAG